MSKNELNRKEISFGLDFYSIYILQRNVHVYRIATRKHTMYASVELEVEFKYVILDPCSLFPKFYN